MCLFGVWDLWWFAHRVWGESKWKPLGFVAPLWSLLFKSSTRAWPRALSPRPWSDSTGGDFLAPTRPPIPRWLLAEVLVAARWGCGRPLVAAWGWFLGRIGSLGPGVACLPDFFDLTCLFCSLTWDLLVFGLLFYWISRLLYTWDEPTVSFRTSLLYEFKNLNQRCFLLFQILIGWSS